jgi:hypothetical protein
VQPGNEFAIKSTTKSINQSTTNQSHNHPLQETRSAKNTSSYRQPNKHSSFRNIYLDRSESLGRASAKRIYRTISTLMATHDEEHSRETRKHQNPTNNTPPNQQPNEMVIAEVHTQGPHHLSPVGTPYYPLPSTENKRHQDEPHEHHHASSPLQQAALAARKAHEMQELNLQDKNGTEVHSQGHHHLSPVGTPYYPLPATENPHLEDEPHEHHHQPTPLQQAALAARKSHEMHEPGLQDEVETEKAQHHHLSPVGTPYYPLPATENSHIDDVPHEHRNQEPTPFQHAALAARKAHEMNQKGDKKKENEFHQIHPSAVHKSFGKYFFVLNNFQEPLLPLQNLKTVRSSRSIFLANVFPFCRECLLACCLSQCAAAGFCSCSCA